MHCCNQNIITTSFVENNLKSTSKKEHKEIKLVDFHVQLGVYVRAFPYLYLQLQVKFKKKFFSKGIIPGIPTTICIFIGFVKLLSRILIPIEI